MSAPDVWSPLGRAGLCVVALALGGCNLVFGLDAVPGTTRDAGDAAIDAADNPDAQPDATVCLPTALPGSEPIAAAILDVQVQGAIATDANRYVFGPSIQAPPDGMVVQYAGGGTTVYSIGGLASDALFSGASAGTEAIAVGYTRSFLTGLTNDHGLVVRLPDGQAPSAVRVYDPSDVGWRFTAAGDTGTQWVVGGNILDGSAAIVVRLNRDLTVDRAVRLVLSGSTAHRVRRVLFFGSTVYVVGTGGTGGFAAAFDMTFVRPSWIALTTAQIFDARVTSAGLELAGAFGVDGAIVRLDLTTGGRLGGERIPGRIVHRIDTHAGQRWIGGPIGAGVYVASAEGSCVAGVDVAQLTTANPILMPLPLVFTGTPTLFGFRDPYVLAIPLGTAESCMGSPFLAATVDAPGIPATLLLSNQYSATAVTLTSAAVAAVSNPVTTAADSVCP